jgi:ornithine cyclodeaminase/alanine dehydrogenase-like protein (mu-crystallin family)
MEGLGTTGRAETGIRYLRADEVNAAMPPVAERLALAERAMTALVGEADPPPKIGVHPRPSGAFAHAMPAALLPADPDGAGRPDLLGIKWVTGFPANAASGLAAIHAVVIVSDPLTGVPTAILDGGPITAQRTAAVSGVAIARFGPSGGGSAVRAAIIGAGVQGHSHLEVLGYVLPGIEVTVHDRHPDRAAQLMEAAEATPGIAAAATAATPRAAVEDADVVITVASFAPPDERQRMTGEWLEPGALVVAVDYATMCAASVAQEAGLFLVDDRGQFLANRDKGQFDDYPDPMATLGEAILAGTSRPAKGGVVVTHLGVGLADVIFADAILRRAAAAGLGTLLPR